MPIDLKNNVGVTNEVDDASTRATRAVLKALGYGVLGHYRTAHRCVLAPAQAANARLFEVRNSGTNLVIPTRLEVKLIQSAAGTAQENSIDVFRATGFTVLDTVNTVALGASVMRTTGMATAAAAAAQILGVTVAGAAAGMTGGTLTKDGAAIAQQPLLISAAAAPAVLLLDALDEANSGAHGIVLAQNEGLIIENRALNVTSYGFSLYIEFGWAEVPAY